MQSYTSKNIALEDLSNVFGGILLINIKPNQILSIEFMTGPVPRCAFSAYLRINCNVICFTCYI